MNRPPASFQTQATATDGCGPSSSRSQLEILFGTLDARNQAAVADFLAESAVKPEKAYLERLVSRAKDPALGTRLKGMAGK